MNKFIVAPHVVRVHLHEDAPPVEVRTCDWDVVHVDSLRPVRAGYSFAKACALCEALNYYAQGRLSGHVPVEADSNPA